MSSEFYHKFFKKLVKEENKNRIFFKKRTEETGKKPK